MSFIKPRFKFLVECIGSFAPLLYFRPFASWLTDLERTKYSVGMSFHARDGDEYGGGAGASIGCKLENVSFE